MKRLVVCCALLLAVAGSAVAETPANPQKPGKWNIKAQMEIPGMPFKMPPINMDICLTEEDLKDPQKSVPNDPKAKCTVSDYKIDGNTVRWTVDCPKDKTRGEGELTFSEDKYTGWMKMQVGEQEMTTKYTGTWKGTCTK